MATTLEELAERVNQLERIVEELKQEGQAGDLVIKQEALQAAGLGKRPRVVIGAGEIRILSSEGLAEHLEQEKATDRDSPEVPIWLVEGREPTRDEIIAWLEAHGMPVAELPPEALALAREWEELPEEEKAAHRAYMDSLRLDPPLSEIILRNRR